jgi:NADH dehydrogenase
VNFIFGDPIARVGEGVVELKSGTVLEADLFIWTGGVEMDPVCAIEFEVRGRRIAVDEFCRARGREEVFVAGDSACVTDEVGAPQQPTAHIATTQADTVAWNVLASVNGGDMKPYVFSRVGEIVTLGRTYAVGELFGIKFTGMAARILKRVVHWRYVLSVGSVRLLLGL